MTAEQVYRTAGAIVSKKIYVNFSMKIYSKNEFIPKLFPYSQQKMKFRWKEQYCNNIKGPIEYRGER